MLALFERIPLEVSAKIIEHPITLPTKRGALSGGRHEVLVVCGGERQIYTRDHFMRTHKPLNQAAKEMLKRLIDGS